MQTLRFDTALELKFSGVAGTFEGYASVFDNTDSAGDRIEKGAFEKSLAQWRRDGRLPPLLWQHDVRQPIGSWQEIIEDAHGLFVRGQLFTDDIARAKEAYRLMRENVVTGLSIGYRVVQSLRDPKTGVRVLTEIELLEISMVTFPANDLARIHAVKAAIAGGSIPSEREFEVFLREAGFSRKQAKSVVARGYRSLLPRDAETGSDTDAGLLYGLADKILSLT